MAVRLRNEKYTGDNRCILCTLVNLLIIACLTLLFGLFSPVLAVFILLVFSVTLYLRGYVIPGTPTLTERYFPRSILSLFGKAESTPGTETNADTQQELNEFLQDHGIIKERTSGNDFELVSEFQTQLESRVDEFRDDPNRQAAQLSKIVDVDADEINFVEIDQTGYYSAEIEDGERIAGAAWESKAAFVTDMAAESILEERVQEWSEIDVDQTDQLLSSIRTYLDECPVCRGDITIETDVQTGCCGAQDVYKLQCSSCSSNLVRAGHA